MAEPSPFSQIKEKEELALGQAQITRTAPAYTGERKLGEYEASLLYKVTHAPTPEQAANVLKGELVRFIHLLKEYWGRIAGYHGALAVDVPMLAPLPLPTRRRYIALSDVKEIRLSTEGAQDKLAAMVIEARGRMNDLKKAQKGRLGYQEMGSFCGPGIAFAEKNQKLLLRLLIAAGATREQFGAYPPVKKFSILQTALKVLGSLKD